MARRFRLSLSLLCVAFAVAGTGSQIYAYALTVTNYPLTTFWSESGRIFEAASVYSPLVFGKTLAWPWLDPAKAILDGLVFLFHNGQIWQERFWLVWLTFSTTALFSFLVIKRAWHGSVERSDKEADPLFLSLWVVWAILYILQCPINYHVLLGAIFVLWLSDLNKPILTSVIVIIASAWEGLGRVNWFLMPAVLVVVVYLLSVPLNGRKRINYLLWPVIWCVCGALASLCTYGIFIKATHNIIPFYDPHMHYGFFLFKLRPNAGFSLGLIPGIILLSAPIILLLALGIKQVLQIQWIRSLALLGILAVFFIGSTIVSLRAGGGFDLHNYDTFALILLVIGSYWSLAAVRLEGEKTYPAKAMLNHPAMLLGLLSVPLFFAIRGIPAPKSYNEQEAKSVIQQLQSIVDNTDTRKGPLLFIDYRHLLAYHMISAPDFYMPYEKIDLMEMAMANNRSYLDQFWNDVAEQKFSLIVSEELHLFKQDAYAPFGYENNVWVANVSEPVLRYYHLVYSQAGLAIYAPTLGSH